ncbi:TIGR02391 family protein [Streptomyces sp. NPDC002623]
MRQEFKPDGGVLTDTGAHPGEQTAVMELFTGAIGAFKNLTSHRTVTLEDPMEAAEIIQVADFLLRILRRAEQRKPSGTATTGTATAEV